MEFLHGHVDENRHDLKERNAGESTGGGSTLLKAKTAELKRIKEKLKKAKDDAEQSWLDSKPLIDELENLQSELVNMKSQAAISGATISDLECRIGEIGFSIRSKKEEELKLQTAIEGINQELNRTKEEIEQLLIERDENHRTISHLKKVSRTRNQSLQALELAERATRLEAEAYGASAAEANLYVNYSHQRDETSIKLTQQEYIELVRKAREETAFAEWRISVAMEQKYAAEENRNSSKRRLQNLLYTKTRKTRKRRAQNGPRNQNNVPEVEEYFPSSDEKEEKDHTAAVNRQKGFRRKLQEQNVKKNNKVSMKKKKSLFSRLRIFLLAKIRRYLK